jgi:glycosyltransferase involved in cell wall biosynthesis
MRIAQVAPLFESVPPRTYGGTERVVSYLTEALVDQGHEVTLFASADSVTSAVLVPMAERSLRAEPGSLDWMMRHLMMIDRVFEQAAAFDVIHFHIDFLHYPLARHCATPCLTTLHGRLDLPGLRPLHEQFGTHPLVSISHAQRRPLSNANWCATVHHGVPEALYRFHAQAQDYFAFLGRISPEKRVDRAIEIAIACGVPLRIAAKVDPVDRLYYENEIAPLIDGRFIDYVGEIDEHEKAEFLGNALALLFPIDWPEPFGLAMIEALACGTPVIAFRRGSVPEVIDEDVSGCIVDDVAGAVAAVARMPRWNRRLCRESFEQRFSSRRMAMDYCEAYERLRRRAWRLSS